MKHFLAFAPFMLCLIGCDISPKTPDNHAFQEHPRTAVTLTHAKPGSIRQTIVLYATTAYQNKYTASAPISAFIAQSFIQSGTRVKAGQPIYQLETKEQHALGNHTDKLIPVTTSRSGIVIEAAQHTGSYVTEGTTLCTIAESGSLIFEINVPYEQQRYACNGCPCTLELPDGTRLNATIESPLATMNTAAQTECVIARATAPFLPEGMCVKAILTTPDNSEQEELVLPKAAIQSDETMTTHWVMTLAEDSTARKVPVELTGCNSTEAAIRSEQLSPQDPIILTGGYGLENGAKVVVTP